MTPAFNRMRQGLIDRGLLTADFQITPAGHAWVDEQLVALRDAQAKPIEKPPVSWKPGWLNPPTRRAA